MDRAPSEKNRSQTRLRYSGGRVPTKREENLLDGQQRKRVSEELLLTKVHISMLGSYPYQRESSSQ